MKKIKNSLLILALGCVVFACSSRDKDDKCEMHDKKREHKDGHRGHHRGHDFNNIHSDRMNPDSMAMHRTEFMKRELSLTEDQVPKVEALNLKYAQKMKALRDQMKSIEDERAKELSTVLTKEQVEKLNDRKKGDWHRGREHRDSARK